MRIASNEFRNDSPIVVVVRSEYGPLPWEKAVVRQSILECALVDLRGKAGAYAKSISDIEPPGGIIGITASSFGITTSISTGPGVAKASAMMRERSFAFSIRKPLAP